MKVIRPDGTQAQSIEDAKTILETAQSEFEKETQAYNEAFRKRTAALEKLNAAQKAFDAAVSDFRGFAPAGSGWEKSTNTT